MNTSLDLTRPLHDRRGAPRARRLREGTTTTRPCPAPGPTLRLPSPGWLLRACTALAIGAITALLLALGVPLPVLPLAFGALLTAVLLIAGLRLD